MSKSKRQPQAARKLTTGDTPAPSSPLSLSAINSVELDAQAIKTREEQVARGWREQLNKQFTPSKANSAKPSTEPAVMGEEITYHAEIADVMTASPAELPTDHDDSKNAHPSQAGGENDNTDIEKENLMQTAKHDKSIIETDAGTKVDLRDMPAAKISSLKDGVKSLSDDGIGSLFGPAIEDDAKGVRSQIRELIQCEMQGELGQRFSRNLRIVIRREIAAAIDDQFDRV